MDMMQVFFFTDAQLNNLLFKGLDITSTSGMVGASFVVFGATILFELLKLVKLYLDLKMRENPLAGQSTCEEMPEESRETNHDGVILLNSLRIPVSRQIRARKLNLHVLNCLSHAINVFYGYLLMLVVMTYSVWLTVAVVVGSAVGYWIFGAIGQLLRETSFQATHQSVMGKHQMPHSETVQTGFGSL
ncbi:probable low affinity copper uptake protein 2 isoform X2 [Pomacea canaliculata]|uniref:probable low affinity copper uptake protein 2 isoform X2 n=1 Tax=Pomacea canaliculata TaxID=400727 RepID=UPI000D7332E0|nr:probable low affinity copper uptake protein 2 isoform X2 [Pomacea canaliculata]